VCRKVKNLLRLQWATTKGVEDIEVLRLLTEDLQRDLRSKLCDNLLTAVRTCSLRYEPAHCAINLLTAVKGVGGDSRAALTSSAAWPNTQAHEAYHAHRGAPRTPGI